MLDILEVFVIVEGSSIIELTISPMGNIGLFANFVNSLRYLRSIDAGRWQRDVTTEFRLVLQM
jgi:hypothetical protein